MSITDHKKTLAAIFFLMGLMEAVIWLMIGGFYGYEWMMLISAVFFMFTGFQLHNSKPGAKILGIVASLLCLPSFPIGTIIGIYGMWYFIYRAKEDF